MKGADFLMTLNIVMVEPQIPQNTGNIARTCAATGTRLHLVGPMAFEIDDKKLKRAGLDYWDLLDVNFYENINEFFYTVSGGKLCQSTSMKSSSQSTLDVTTTTSNTETMSNYPDTSDYEFYYVETHAPNVYTEPCYGDNTYLFFGSETKGLDEALLNKNSSQCVRIPMLAGVRSMNLSSAVAVAVFEVLRQWNFPKLQNFGKMSNTD